MLPCPSPRPSAQPRRMCYWDPPPLGRSADAQILLKCILSCHGLTTSSSIPTIRPQGTGYISFNETKYLDQKGHLMRHCLVLPNKRYVGKQSFILQADIRAMRTSSPLAGGTSELQVQETLNIRPAAASTAAANALLALLPFVPEMLKNNLFLQRHLPAQGPFLIGSASSEPPLVMFLESTPMKGLTG